MREELSPALESYQRFRASQGIGKNTIRNEMSNLKVFLRVNGNIWCHQIDDRQVTRFFEELAKTRSMNSLRPVDSALRSFFDWCRNTRRMPVDRDPMFGRRRPKAIKRERQRVHVSKFPTMLDNAEAVSPWHRALTATLLYTLLRGGEVADLRIRDVDLDGGFLRTRIFKTNQEDLLPISVELDRELRKWLTVYTTEVGPLEPHYYLIPKRHGIPIPGPNGRYRECRFKLHPEVRVGKIAEKVKPILESVGVAVDEGGEGGHTLRRSGARALFDALSEAHHPRPLRVVKDMLHHASESVTERYIGVEADRLDRDMVIRGREMFALPVGNVVAMRDAR